jgi:hypothetical protein
MFEAALAVVLIRTSTEMAERPKLGKSSSSGQDVVTTRVGAAQAIQPILRSYGRKYNDDVSRQEGG